MSHLDMIGPYPFTAQQVDNTISKLSAGNYAIGYKKHGAFIPTYIGRSDSDLKKRLKSHIENYTIQDAFFMYSYASSPKAAFEKECKNYHDFENQLLNKIHPDQPSNNSKKWHCPVISCEKSKK
ncbi:hypothetical protein [Xenorhabdus sp. KK7.4]|uniref:hypothetical protein n=1 Tax=Xenorhabdus sp. KK7.4 TaxID=1851572 RepID=UPI000C0649DA|nr:hypothetical protein [Xenorhabdus sp. KK7.4]PHM51250.1 hypothetical protein Xekk_03823 [Xenorhabdus sp. KK7.4]